MGIVLRHAEAVAVHEAEIALRGGIPLVGGFAKPGHGLGRVLRHAATVPEHFAEFVLRRGVPLLGGLSIPLRGKRPVFAQTATHHQMLREVVLGLGLAGLGARFQIFLQVLDVFVESGVQRSERLELGVVVPHEMIESLCETFQSSRFRQQEAIVGCDIVFFQPLRRDAGLLREKPPGALHRLVVRRSLAGGFRSFRFAQRAQPFEFLADGLAGARSALTGSFFQASSEILIGRHGLFVPGTEDRVPARLFFFALPSGLSPGALRQCVRAAEQQADR
ncbi:MAG: hypothetical protein LKM39_11440 [Chiayiivirga sp.]|nr:hypothetical protein [Chiayiivirga sp.]